MLFCLPAAIQRHSIGSLQSHIWWLSRIRLLSPHLPFLLLLLQQQASMRLLCGLWLLMLLLLIRLIQQWLCPVLSYV